MAAPNLQAEGTINAVTTGTLTVTNPSHATDDILVAIVGFFGPNGPVTGNPGTPSGWSVQQAFAPTSPGALCLFWVRATSGAMTNPTFTRGSGPWDTGTDTCFFGRVYTIRGCITTGTPWDDIQWSTIGATANATFPAVTVSGSERTVIQFHAGFAANSAGAAPSGWTAGTEAQTTTGTDANEQTFRKENVSSSTGADTSNAAANANGYLFGGVSFKPPDTTPVPRNPGVNFQDPGVLCKKVGRIFVPRLWTPRDEPGLVLV